MIKTWLALYPFSPTSKSDEETGVCYEYKNGIRVISNWHLVFFGRWIDTKHRFPAKCQFSIDFDTWSKQLLITRYFGKNLTYGENDKPYNFKVVDTPLTRVACAEEFLADKWISVDIDDKEALEKAEEQATHKVYTFEHNGETVNATVFASGIIRGFHWLPKFLRTWFATSERCIDITFDKEVGSAAGSWKGGVLGLYSPFKNSLDESWEHFVETRLPLL